VPQRDRGERRVAELLEAAAETFAEAGYEGATMTAIAERAGASIGAVYQYFPNKEALGLALRAQYASELSARWTPLTTMETASVDELVERVFAVLFEFFAVRPAFVPLLNAPFHYPGNPAQRVRLREDFAKLFRKKKPALGSAEAFRVANVALNIIRAMYPMYAEARGKERLEVGTEFKRVVTAYLRDRLDG
jgi:AcrR family transcriptional regulator